jgi:hypothetical protein
LSHPRERSECYHCPASTHSQQAHASDLAAILAEGPWQGGWMELGDAETMALDGGHRVCHG